MATRRRSASSSRAGTAIDYRSQEQVAWDERLASMTAEMRLCRSKRFHDWVPNGDVVTSSRTDTFGQEIILEFRHNVRCNRGCGTTGSELVSTRTWKRVEGTHFKYDWDPHYKITGEPIDTAALNREKYLNDNPQLFSYLLNGTT